MIKTSTDKNKIRFLLLEGVHPSAIKVLQTAGYSNIESLPGALDGEALLAKIADAHFVGIRSRTQLTAEVLAHAHKLAAVGCFCIGTNQVDLNAARERGIAVFNAPFSNTRSVAELVATGVVDDASYVYWDVRLATRFPTVEVRVADVQADAEDAAEWHAAGLSVFARETGPVPLEIIEVELEGEFMLLPWLGSGSVEHNHIEGENHPIELLWDPHGDAPSIRIARAWLDQRSGKPRTVAEPGVDWDAVGMPAPEVLGWLEGIR